MTKCVDSRQCFARKKSGDCMSCGILIPEPGAMNMYVDGECPFCKPKRDYTDGVYYGNYEKTLRLLSHKERGKAV